MSMLQRSALPSPTDFAAPPDVATRRRWDEADRVARPTRLAHLRERMATEGVDAYFGVRHEHMRYLTGFAIPDVTGAGHSGQFFVTADELVVLTDSRYTLQMEREAPEARIEHVYHNMLDRWPEIVRSVGARRIAVEAGWVSHLQWDRLDAAERSVELVAIDGWVEADRAVKEPTEVERIAAACAVADGALAALLPRIRPGVTEKQLALDLEWAMRTGGADRLAFDVACLAGPEAALPHGSPGERPVLANAVLLFDFGAEVAGYHSDMTRTLFVGEPTARDLEVYELVARAQRSAIERLQEVVTAGGSASGREIDAAARSVIKSAGHAEHFGHSLGHGIGLATHEQPSLGPTAPDTPLPSPTVFSVEPGVYLGGETGVRIEDLVLFDPSAQRLETLTHFPRDVVVVGV